MENNLNNFIHLMMIAAFIMGGLTLWKGVGIVKQYRVIVKAYLNGTSFLNMMYKEICPIIIRYNEGELTSDDTVKLKTIHEQVEGLSVGNNPIFRPILESKYIIQTLIEQIDKEEK